MHEFFVFLLPFKLTIIKFVFKDLGFRHSICYASHLSLFPSYPTLDLDNYQKSLSSVIQDHQVINLAFSNLIRLKNMILFYLTYTLQKQGQHSYHLDIS